MSTTYKFDIIAATYYNLDVTLFLRQKVASLDPSKAPFAFTPSPEYFGITDPARGTEKACVVVWRVADDQKKLYSQIQASTAAGNNKISLQYDPKQPLRPYTPIYVFRDLILINATWYNFDCTEQVEWEFTRQGGGVSSTVTATAAFPSTVYPPISDPKKGTLKQLTVTFGYLLSDGTLLTAVKTALGNDNITVSTIAPPMGVTLEITAASYYTVDVTSTLRQKYVNYATVNPATRTSFVFSPSTSYFGINDPANGTKKACVVVWRVINTNNNFCSKFQTSTAEEGGTISIQYDNTGLLPYTPINVFRDLTLINATWFTLDATAQVVWEFATDGTNSETLTATAGFPTDVIPSISDPKFGTHKQLSLIYGYLRPDKSLLRTEMKTALDSNNITVSSIVRSD